MKSKEDGGFSSLHLVLGFLTGKIRLCGSPRAAAQGKRLHMSRRLANALSTSRGGTQAPLSLPSVRSRLPLFPRPSFRPGPPPGPPRSPTGSLSAEGPEQRAPPGRPPAALPPPPDQVTAPGPARAARTTPWRGLAFRGSRSRAPPRGPLWLSRRPPRGTRSAASELLSFSRFRSSPTSEKLRPPPRRVL